MEKTVLPDHPLPAPRDRWRFDRLFLAPHRLAFACGALLLCASGVWWAAVNLAASLGSPVPGSMPAGIAHSVVMTFGFMPFFFSGFLFTAGPKWLKHPPVEARALVPCLLPQVAGWGVFLVSVHAADPAFGQVLGALALAAVALGWAMVMWRFVALLRHGRSDDKLHASLVAVGCGVGTLALCLATFGVASGALPLVQAAVQLGLWGFVGLVFAAVAHRMTPFFSAAAFPALDAWAPRWLLWTFVATFGLRALAAAGEAMGWARGAGWTAGLAVAELSAAIACLALAVRWGLMQSLRIRLLAMLHAGFCWLGAALVLFGTAHAVEALGGPAAVFGLAPIHAYSMGYLATTMLAMVTRVSCGHGGRTVAADDFLWRLFWLLQLATVVRLAGALLAQADDGRWALAAIVAAACGWAVVASAWGMRYGHWFGTPRPDGRPG